MISARQELLQDGVIFQSVVAKTSDGVAKSATLRVRLRCVVLEDVEETLGSWLGYVGIGF